jgi:hypothetical protein
MPKEPAMSIPAEIAIWGVTAIAAAIVAGIVAGIKNRDYSFWIATAFLLPPLLLVLILMPRLKQQPVQVRTTDDDADSDRA